MRLIVGALVLFAGIIGYGAYRQRQAKLVQIERAAAVVDSLERVDSLQRIAEVDAAASHQGPRRSIPSQIALPESRPPAPLRLRKQATVIMRNPGPTNRRP